MIGAAVQVGTAFSGGEDVPTRGRILLLEVTRQMTGPNSAIPQWSGRVLHAHEFKGATRGAVSQFSVWPFVFRV